MSDDKHARYAVIHALPHALLENASVFACSR